MTPAETVTPIAWVRGCFEADPHVPSGLRWRTRLPEHFNASSHRSAEHRCKNWNAKWAGKPAGAQNQNGHFVVELTIGTHKLQLLAHRIVYALARGYWPPDEVDHKDGVEAGNGIGNLRDATRNQNMQNLKLVAANTSGFPGVSWDKEKQKWSASIRGDGRNIHLAYFDTPEAAFAAYCAAKAILHPFQPMPRGVATAELRPVDRMKMAHRIVRAARVRGNPMLELDAWDHFIAAM